MTCQFKKSIRSIFEQENSNPEFCKEPPLSEDEILELSEMATLLYPSSRVKKYTDGEIKANLYRERKDKKQTPIEFLKATWGVYLDEKTIFQDQIRKLDPHLVNDLRKYLYKNKLPLDYVPTKSNRIERLRKILTRYNLGCRLS